MEHSASKLHLVSVKKIWDQAPHNALTDLIYFGEKWYCVFREGDAHVEGRDGVIRIIQSLDGENWKPAALFQEEGVDLRDPKLSLTSNHQLMLLYEGVHVNRDDRIIVRQPRTAFSDNGKNWSSRRKILSPHEWLWRLTWHREKAYGASYRLSNPREPEKEWMITLFESSNGIDYTKMTQWEIHGHPSEATLQFQNNGDMIALVRREAYAWIGWSPPPYRIWKWSQTRHHLGGPHFLILPDGNMWASGRLVEKNPYGIFQKTAIAAMTRKTLQPVLVLPSGGEDCSYPGMVFRENLLWVSYYSSHEGKTAIYLAKIDLTRVRLKK
ncbi:MAG: hypothetical protein WB791_09670 [Waddliaceae bacterium]